MNIIKSITVFTTGEASELVADAMYGVGSEGVSIYDSADFKTLLAGDIIWDYVDEGLLDNSPVVRVTGYFDKDFHLDNLIDALDVLKRNCPFNVGSLEVATEEVDGDAWIDIWRSYARPIREGKVVVLPEWTDCGFKPQEGDVIIRLDPGMAFGTGEHETTKLCIRLMQDVLKQGDRVLDVGTGSGILAIAAAKLGAGKVDACDIDAQAVEACLRNCEKNGVADKVNACVADLTAAASGKYDVIIGNITADILIRLSKDIRAYMGDSACAIISGIIHSRAGDVEKEYAAAGFEKADIQTMGEWRAYRWI